MEYKNIETGHYEAASGKNGAMNTRQTAVEVIAPVDIQAHYQQTIQTHTNAMVAPSAWSFGPWIDANGFERIATSMVNDAATNSVGTVQWSNDGTTIHGSEVLLAVASSKERVSESATKARYFRVAYQNSDAAPHTINAWAFLKA